MRSKQILQQKLILSITIKIKYAPFFNIFMLEIPQLEIYRVVILPPDKEEKIERLEKELNKKVLVSFDKLAYAGRLCKNFKDDFYIKYQTAQIVEEKIIDADSINVIFVKQI